MAEPDGRASIADIAEIYYAPSAVYDRRRNGQFGLPLVVFFIAATVLFFITQDLLKPVMDAEWRLASASMMRKNPELTPEAIEQMRGFQKFAVVGIFFYALLGPLLAGLILWIVEKFVGVKQALKVAITVAVFAFYPMLLEQLVNAAQMLVLSEDSIVSRYSLSLGPARFLGADADPVRRSPRTRGRVHDLDRHSHRDRRSRDCRRLEGPGDGHRSRDVGPRCHSIAVGSGQRLRGGHDITRTRARRRRARARRLSDLRHGVEPEGGVRGRHGVRRPAR